MDLNKLRMKTSRTPRSPADAAYELAFKMQSAVPVTDLSGETALRWMPTASARPPSRRIVAVSRRGALRATACWRAGSLSVASAS